MRLFALLALLVVTGCSSDLYPAGHTCVSSEECAAGLLCDYGQTPHVCAGTSTTGSDLASGGADASVGDMGPVPDQGMPDLAEVDL